MLNERNLRKARTINALIIRVDRDELWQVQLFSQFMNENGTKFLIFIGKLLSFSHIELMFKCSECWVEYV